MGRGLRSDYPPTSFLANSTATNRLLFASPWSERRLLSWRCKVLSAKPWLRQNSFCRNPLASNSSTSRLISSRLRRFRPGTSWFPVIPTLCQKSRATTSCGWCDAYKGGVLSQGCLGELVIKGPARLTPLAKPCSLLGRDSGFIGSRVEETEARTNRKYRNSLRSL